MLSERDNKQSNRDSKSEQALCDACVARTGEAPESVRWFCECETTMDEAKGCFTDSPASSALVVADAQTKGRGRLDRSWEGTSGASLLMTAGFRDGEMAHRGSWAPALAGVATVWALRDRKKSQGGGEIAQWCIRPQVAKRHRWG